MTSPDDDFEDFLERRKPVFRRPADEQFEPPPELDRLVLRQAREAIRPEEPMRVFSAPRWSMPIALAATLLLAFTIIFQAGMPGKPAPKAEVTVQNVADTSAPPAPPPPAVMEAPAHERAMDSAPAKAADAPAWRRDSKSWLAEISRLREAGNIARADAEQAEFNRQQRAYAVAPDR